MVYDSGDDEAAGYAQQRQRSRLNAEARKRTYEFAVGPNRYAEYEEQRYHGYTRDEPCVS